MHLKNILNKIYNILFSKTKLFINVKLIFPYCIKEIIIFPISKREIQKKIRIQIKSVSEISKLKETK